MSSARVLCAVYILLVLSAVAFCTNPSVTCGTGTCPANSGCCVWSPPGSPQINQCYDTNLFTCTNDQSLSGQQCLCATNQQCCNKACFNPATFSCVQNYGNNGPTCLCTPGQGCCNGQCFNTNIFFCVLADNKPGKRCLCQVGAHDRCYYNFSNDQQTCYNSNTQTVCNNQIVDINSIARITITSTPSQNCNQPTTLTCTATGNFAPYSYQWTASGGGTISGPSNVMTISATSSGTYTCTVTGTNNCPVSKSTTITTPTCCSASITASPSTPTCETPVSLQCNPSGTTGAVTYQWTTAGGAIQGPTNTQIITATQTGSYTCSITDASACTASATQSVTISKLGVTVTPNPANACSGPVSLTCNPSNAAGPVSYQWTASGGGVISGSTTTQSISATATGTYTCTATDTICTKSASSTVNIGSINVFVVPPTANGCAGAPQTFTCNAITNNGPVTYQWVASNGGVIAGPVTTQSIIATTTGTYTCTATDTNGCSGSASGNAVISNAQVSISGPLSVCNVASSPLTCNVANAVGPVVYNWVASNGGTIGGPNNGQVIQALTTGTYTCTATDSSQCPVQASVPFVLSNPTVNVQKITPGCTAPATLSCTVSGPVTGPVVYFWTGPGIVGPNNQMTVQVNAPGLYTCSAGSATCQDQASLSVSVSPISATVVPPTANTCGQSAQFTCQAAGAFGPVTYAWTASGGGSISGSTTTQTITALTTGTYTCVVTDSGCSATASGTLNTNSCDCTNFELHIAPQYGSTENTGAEAVLNFDFNQVGANAVLTLLITNVAASTQSTLVGVAFDIPAGAPTPTYQSLGSSFDKFWIDPDLPPFGTFDIGTSPDRPTFAGGNPQTGLTNGQQTTVQFTFANTNAQTLATNFYNGFLSEELRATGRFQQVGPNQEGSDKVLGGGVECLN